MASKKVSSMPPTRSASTNSASGRTSPHSSSKRSWLNGSPSTQMRSVTSSRCGLLNRPTRRPIASRIFSIMIAVLPLPLVPVIWMTG